MLNFPINPTTGQTYQTGSSATYRFSGLYWEIVTPRTQIFLNTPSASFATTALSATTASFATTAQALIGTPAFVYGSKNNSTQTITANTDTLVTNWSAFEDTTQGQWNSTTGIFTAATEGVYLANCSISYFSPTPSAVGVFFRVIIRANGISARAESQFVSPNTNIQTLVNTGVASACIRLAAGGTISFWTRHNNSNQSNVDFPPNYFSIAQLR